MKHLIPAAILAVLMAGATATAGNIDLQLGQNRFDDERFLPPDDNSGYAFRISAAPSFGESGFVRIELRRDDARLEYDYGSRDATRDLLRTGLGKRWGSAAFGVDLEAGGASIRGEDSGGLYVEEFSFYAALGAGGRGGDFEWHIDGTHYFKVPPLLYHSIQSPGVTSEPYSPESQTWYGGELLWHYGRDAAIGLRIEDTEDFETVSVLARWTI